ncbi:hypothetical protein GGS23DRAFT_605978 [Durotheca rogersii]|uniref:uncharacterized protein n=1 Tax=Durotheca rogersii TaxID=419775 RepID=UPI0022200DE8|nr:uncharacterized protein GGS23DRAFT_605978 [Durotheca rogersii]KAI5862070.1 hypothetical protein GGS23DRAFT_605978 [Durotheca rogersii]
MRASSFVNLPAELHILISQQLTYPDALSLKHANRYFYHLVDTGLKLKVDWLIERRSLHLECPNDRCCDLGSDLKFCRGSVRLLMQRRREHFECESRPGLGCLVYGTKRCAHRQQPGFWIKRWLRLRVSIELWWAIVVMAPVLFAFLWMIDLAAWRVKGAMETTLVS